MSDEETTTRKRPRADSESPPQSRKAVISQKLKATDGRIFVVCSKKADKDILLDNFESFGEIKDLTILRDSQGLSKGCCFITFEDPRCAKAAIALMDGEEIHDKPLKVMWADEKDSYMSQADRKQDDNAPQGLISLDDLDKSGIAPLVEEEEDPEEEARRERLLNQAVEISLAEVKNKQAEIENAVAERDAGRQYNPDEYDY
eukprot:c2095_g1_i1.p1 GENE.c2095_g1_i1~~c2095_g1_i1.p1  ORF type:complete len:215 (-),score=56.42 c2095_g1_i1:104-709(-)